MRDQRGVTLTEMMVAVVICGLLASIAVPSYRAAIERSRNARAATDIIQIGGAIERWHSNTYTLPTTLAEVGFGGLLDPWGRPYRYLRIATATAGQVRRDRNLRPINSDYDLYSAGKDGETQTQLQAVKARDDIVRANNGSFIGLARDY